MSLQVAPLLDAALNYARRGFSVIPIAPRSKIPLIPWKRYQTQAATEKEILSWWERSPQANVGIVTGLVSGLLVVDFDPRHDAAGETGKWLRALLPEPTVRTGGGGLHWYIKAAYRSIPSLLPGLDVKSNGGFVLAPCSVHESGTHYIQLRADLCTMPSALRDLIKQRTHDEGKSRNSNSNGQNSADSLSLDDALSVLQGVKQTSKGWLARCPAHDDHSPSLGVGEGREGRLLVKCFSGCAFVSVMAAIRQRYSQSVSAAATALNLR